MGRVVALRNRYPGRPLFAAWAIGLFVLVAAGAATGQPAAAVAPADTSAERQRLAEQFSGQLLPFLKKYCLDCHGVEQQEGMLNLGAFVSVADIAKSYQVWTIVAQRLEAEEMPPAEAAIHPTTKERAATVKWIKAFHRFEAAANAGDPGQVLARRLSNEEYDNSIRDLTGVDLRPTREFPVDPANEAGFDNSGESLTMSPELLAKYLAAVQEIADHVVFLPDGIRFANHLVVTDSDRDNYCVQRLLRFYEEHDVDLSDYIQAAWEFRHRDVYGRPDESLAEVAARTHISPRYLAALWDIFSAEPGKAGPIAVVQTMWRELPSPDRDQTSAPRAEFKRIGDVIALMRNQLRTSAEKPKVRGISPGSQPFVLWQDRQQASNRLHYVSDVVSDLNRLRQKIEPVAPQCAALLAVNESAPQEIADLKSAMRRFCYLFPDTFCVVQRGPYFDPASADQQRPLTAGFHLMLGFFRDDEPLVELVLEPAERRQLDALWLELEFITSASRRQYKDFVFFERAEPPRFMFGPEFDFARSEDMDVTSADKIQRLRTAYLAKAKENGADEVAVKAIEDYFTEMSSRIRGIEHQKAEAEPSHLAAVLRFAERAFRRPLKPAERAELIGLYRMLRDEQHRSHEDAIRDTLAGILISPYFLYRVDLASEGAGVQPLDDYELASRLSYFLWASMPDDELLRHAATGDLHLPDVLTVQVRRMLRDERVRGLATEFFGNLLDFRRFEEHNSVDRGRFPQFTNELRRAMFEEPIRFVVDLIQHNRSVVQLLDATHTFVNPVLAKHYGLSFEASSADQWVQVEDATAVGRGGLLTMAVFLTHNSPGLRTSPVKRGYWIVRRVLGERIPAPPPTVPQLPDDEAQLGEMTLAETLARHRADSSCAACHQRFDSIGLVFEDYGPIGQRRERDLGGRTVDNRAVFPDGVSRQGVNGLRQYLREQRQEEFLDNLTSKLFVYALGRSLLPSDQPTLSEIKARVIADGYTFNSLVEGIVGSPQFLQKRGGNGP
jgi:mono/diheme cytochrome c family protein